jgi:hypothetical protein
VNDNGPGPLNAPRSVAGIAEFFYFDANGDRAVAPIDVLQIINFLNNPASNSEGEHSTALLPRQELLLHHRTDWHSVQFNDIVPPRRGTSTIPTTYFSSRTEFNAVLPEPLRRFDQQRRAKFSTRSHNAALEELLVDEVLQDLGNLVDL